MNKELVGVKLRGVLESCKKVDFTQAVDQALREPFEGIELYLLDDKAMDEVRLLEASVKGMMGGNEEYAGKAFFEFAKIINPDYPAFKYSFFVKKTPVEIFDRDKVKQAIPGEMERWKNKERLRLERTIKDHVPPLSESQANKLREDLETRLSEDFDKLQKVLDNWDSYDAVITTHAHCKAYPSIYYTMDTSSNYGGSSLAEKQQYYKKKDTFLRSSVPNLLWFKDDRPFSELRANDKISRIVQTYTPYCGTIYVKERE